MTAERTCTLVTGAAGAIGRAVCLRLGAEGRAVAVLDVDPVKAEETAAAVREDGGSGLAVPCDVSGEASLREAVEEARRRLGPADLLVNAAGVLGPPATMLADLDTAAWERVFAVNVRGTWLACRAVLPGMVERGGGRIVNLASGAAHIGVAGLGAYAASKAAVLSLTRTLALEHAADGIRVTAVSPGNVDTPMIGALADALGEAGDPDPRASLVRYHAVPRLATVEDVAGVVAFLASADADFVTGSTILVDGGALAGRP